MEVFTIRTVTGVLTTEVSLLYMYKDIFAVCKVAIMTVDYLEKYCLCSQ